MSLLIPRSGSHRIGQSLRRVVPGTVVMRKAPSAGRMTFAPADRAASAIPLRVKQLTGSLMGLSLTATEAAPALKQRPATSARSSGLVVAESMGGLAKA